MGKSVYPQCGRKNGDEMMEKTFQYLDGLLYDTDGSQWSGLCDWFLRYGVPVILAIVAGCLAVWLVILIRQWILRIKVGRRYDVFTGC